MIAVSLNILFSMMVVKEGGHEEQGGQEGVREAERGFGEGRRAFGKDFFSSYLKKGQENVSCG